MKDVKENKGISKRNQLYVRYKNSTSGITLIALVITIIILLILAGVTIATLTGDNGILTQAGKAKDKTAEAEAIERIQVEIAGSYGTDGKIDLDQLNKNLKSINGLTYNGSVLSYSNQIGSLPATVTLNGYNIMIAGNGSVSKKITVAEAKADGTVFEDNTIIYDEYENQIKISEGFKIASDSATDVTGGIVIEDASYDETIGSQFVWIPLGTEENSIKKSDGTIVEIELGRYIFDSDGTPSVISKYYTEDTLLSHNSSYGNTIAKDIEGFIESANSNHGYYIGRYEARKSSAGNLTVVGTDGVYNISQPDSATVSRNMYDSKLPFISDLINSYAWDTAIVFEQTFDDRTTDKTKPYSMQNSLNTNFVATGTNNLTDVTKQDKICNIWDMASNCYEWTTETSSFSSVPCVFRGGQYSTSSSYASYRSRHFTNIATNSYSFRPLLYF